MALFRLPPSYNTPWRLIQMIQSDLGRAWLGERRMQASWVRLLHPSAPRLVCILIWFVFSICDLIFWIWISWRLMASSKCLKQNCSICEWPKKQHEDCRLQHLLLLHLHFFCPCFKKEYGKLSLFCICRSYFFRGLMQCSIQSHLLQGPIQLLFKPVIFFLLC